MDTSSPGNTVRCFGQRMLNPFRGVMHCVVTGWADAVTIDGRHWTLYVRGECLYDDLSDIRGQNVTIPDVKYGIWSERGGFQRAPIRLPTFDERVRLEGEQLLDAVIDRARHLPFPLDDHFELWLLHGRTRRPLALIGSCCSRVDCQPPPLARWTPGQACMAEIRAANELCAAVAALAGPQPRAAWFERNDKGAGTRCEEESTDPSPCPASLSAEHFDWLNLDQAALSVAQTELFDEVIDWQSPSWLQLPGLDDAQRQQFESAACGHALRLAEQLPLYPRVLDEAAITAALVEARLRHSTAWSDPAGSRGVPLSPYYLEVADD